MNRTYVLGLIILACLLYFTNSATVGVIGMVFVQFALLFWFARGKMVTNLGAYLAFSPLYFAMRPLYVVINEDYQLMRYELWINPSDAMILQAMFWATIATCMICMGYSVAEARSPIDKTALIMQTTVSQSQTTPKGWFVILLVGFQLIGVIGLRNITHGELTDLYSSQMGAYGYLFPQVVQAVQFFVVVVVADKRRRFGRTWNGALVISSILFLLFTYDMRNVSIFRGFYITGLVGVACALLLSIRNRVLYSQVIVPMVFSLPFFRALGEVRYGTADQAWENLKAIWAVLNLNMYWRFFSSVGDMNIFDTFIAALNSTPSQRPYFYSWIYTFLHWIPRAYWPGKPAYGMVVDMDFCHGRPYHPGYIGFLFLDGGYVWMLGSCFLTGMALFWMDKKVFEMPGGYLRSCLYGIFIVNSMYLPRGLLHFHIYQILTMMVPCLILARLARRFEVQTPTDLPGVSPQLVQ